jgi:ABC-type transporter Mla subunit MlaD
MDVEETIRFILEQQAQLTITVGQLAQEVDRIGQKVDRTADSVIALLAIAEIHDREIKETDDRLSALINIVERLISERRNGRTDA